MSSRGIDDHVVGLTRFGRGNAKEQAEGCPTTPSVPVWSGCGTGQGCCPSPEVQRPPGVYRMRGKLAVQVCGTSLQGEPVFPPNLGLTELNGVSCLKSAQPRQGVRGIGPDCLGLCLMIFVSCSSRAGLWYRPVSCPLARAQAGLLRLHCSDHTDAKAPENTFFTPTVLHTPVYLSVPLPMYLSCRCPRKASNPRNSGYGHKTTEGGRSIILAKVCHHPNTFV